MKGIYYLLEFIFSFLGGIIFLLLNGLSKMESLFHDKIEFYKYSKWLEQDDKYIKNKETK
jgi:hypothetical protein